MDNAIFPPNCPKCKSNQVVCEKQREYTGGGFVDNWYEFYFEKCSNEWRSDKESNYF